MAEEMAHLLDAEEDTPAWAKLLLGETLSIKSDIAQRVSNVEKRINVLEEESNTVTEQSIVTKLQDEIEIFRNQVDDLISRSKRNNIRLVNIKEGAEAGGTDVFLGKILRYILDLKEDEKPPEVDRAHRAPRSSPSPSASSGGLTDKKSFRPRGRSLLFPGRTHSS
ncbi:hypothetical protein ABVT39_012691 [Epinephelus coioides]